MHEGRIVDSPAGFSIPKSKWLEVWHAPSYPVHSADVLYVFVGRLLDVGGNSLYCCVHTTAISMQVPVVVTEQERIRTEGEHHHHHHERMSERVGEEVCGTKTFTEVEDRPIVKERVER